MILQTECVYGYDDCGVCGGLGSTCNVNAVYVRWGRTVCPSRSRLLYGGTSARYKKEQVTTHAFIVIVSGWF